MNIETAVKDVISEKMNDGTIEKIVAEQFENGVREALKDVFKSWGDINKTIKTKIESAMIPYIENYDYSNYVLKLDYVLVEVLKEIPLDNKKMLENFKDLMACNNIPKEIKVSEIFEEWKKHVAKEIECDDLDVCYDDGVHYEPVEVSYEFSENESRSWSDWKSGVIVFECDHDDKFNVEIPIHCWEKYDKGFWSFDSRKGCDISSLRHINEFEIYLMKLYQAHPKVELDIEYEQDEIQPDKEPEPTYS